MQFVSFTSDLSVAEFALAAEAGLRPLRLVGGEGVFRLPPPSGRDYLRPGQTAPLTAQAARWNHARGTVLARLRDEARACGAALVTGVSLRCQVPARRPSPSEPAGWYRVFTATGTALTRRSGPRPGDEPVLTNLRLPDYVKLTSAGLRPAGLVTATAVAEVLTFPGSDAGVASRRLQSVPAGERGSAWSTLIQAGDQPDYHAATRRAYSAALEELRSDAARMGAAGVESVTVDRDRVDWEAEEWAWRAAVFVHAAGTAVTADSPGTRRLSGLAILPVRHLNA